MTYRETLNGGEWGASSRLQVFEPPRSSCTPPCPELHHEEIGSCVYTVISFSECGFCEPVVPPWCISDFHAGDAVTLIGLDTQPLQVEYGAVPKKQPPSGACEKPVGGYVGTDKFTYKPGATVSLSAPGGRDIDAVEATIQLPQSAREGFDGPQPTDEAFTLGSAWHFEWQSDQNSQIELSIYQPSFYKDLRVHDSREVYVYCAADDPGALLLSPQVTQHFQSGPATLTFTRFRELDLPVFVGNWSLWLKGSASFKMDVSIRDP